MAKAQTTLRNIRKRAATLTRTGKLAEARALYTTACNEHPSDSRLWLSLARVDHQLGLYSDAEHCTRQALSLDPASSEAHYCLACICLEGGRVDQAIAHYRRALDIEPTHTEALNNLSAILTNNGELGESIRLLERALKIHPDAHQVMINLARAQLFSGDSSRALQILERVIRIHPENAEARSKYLLCANYQSCEPQPLFEQHRLWQEKYARRITRYTSYENPATEQRPLRIAYLSPDMKNHSVAWFMEPILSHHDREQFNIVGYADVANPDTTSQKLAGYCSEWHWTRGMSDHQLCRKIRADRIDILVDLAGHTANNRLMVFAKKPAPVAVSYLGYPNTTGLDAIDYRITDAIADPPDVADPYYTEKLVRLANGFLCYQPPENSPDTGEPPCRDSGRIVFGSFNNLAKLTDKVIDTWAQILLNTTAGSRLLLKSKGTADPYTRERLEGLFAQHGIGRERLVFLGHTRGSSEHLRMYQQMDIALDPFPYNGTTTTCEALWMGVPVMTLRGKVHSSRVSASLLSRLDLEELISTDTDDYIRTAVELSARHDRLASLRRGLREKMLNSDLCDASAFTRNIEDAYRKMWHSYLNKISN